MEGICQKPALEYANLQHWPQIEQSAISNDGKFGLYVLSGPESTKKLFIQNFQNNVVKKYSGSANFFDACFSEDSRYAFFSLPGDTLKVIYLNSFKEFTIANCNAFKTLEFPNRSCIACYDGRNKELTLVNLSRMDRRKYTGVAEYVFSEDTKNLIIKSANIEDTAAKNSSLRWIDIEKNSVTTFGRAP